MNESLQQALEWRYAVKKFDSTKKVSEKDWKTLEASLVLSPSSYGLQPWKFLVVQNPQLRQQLKEVSWGQSQVTDCSHYVVLVDKKYVSQKLNNVLSFETHFLGILQNIFCVSISNSYGRNGGPTRTFELEDFIIRFRI